MGKTYGDSPKKGGKYPPAAAINAASLFIRRSQLSEGALGTLKEGTAPSLTSFLLRVATLSTIIADGKYHRLVIWVIEKWCDWREKTKKLWNLSGCLSLMKTWKQHEWKQKCCHSSSPSLPRTAMAQVLLGRWSLIVVFWSVLEPDTVPELLLVLFLWYKNVCDWLASLTGSLTYLVLVVKQQNRKCSSCLVTLRSSWGEEAWCHPSLMTRQVRRIPLPPSGEGGPSRVT